jgi:hypothetical protein
MKHGEDFAPCSMPMQGVPVNFEMMQGAGVAQLSGIVH